MASPLFVKGMQKIPGSGRKKGSSNKIKKVAETFAAQGIDPVAEILKRIPELEAKDAVKAWLDLLSYCQAKPKEEYFEQDITVEDVPETFKGLTEEAIIRIVRAEKEIS